MTEIIRQGVEQCRAQIKTINYSVEHEVIESHVEDARHVLMELIRIGGKVRVK